MKEKAYLLFLLIGVLFLAGCKETPSDPAGEDATISLMLGNSRIRGGDLFVGDDVINKVRVYVFSGGHIEAMQVFSTGEPAFVNPFRVNCTTGEKTIFVVANEPANVSDKLNAVKRPDELDAIKLETETFLPKPFTMVGRGTVNISSSAGTVLPMSLKRVVAKITLKVRNASEGGAADISIWKVELHRGAKSTPLIEGVASAPGGFWEGTKPYNAFQPVTAEGFQVWGVDDAAYVFENLGSVSDTTSRATYLMIYARYNNINTTYRAYINDENSDATDHHYSVKRNYHYDLIADIKNLGDADGISLRTEVQPWDVVNNDLLFKRVFKIEPYLTFDAKTIKAATPADVKEFKFKLFNPVGGRWIVHCSNPLDFEFLTTGGAVVSGGVGDEYTIRIRPLRQPSESQDRTTEIFITVDDVEIPLLKNNPSVGEGNRIVILQPKANTP